VEAIVDRQGGRSRYGALLFQAIRPRGLCIEQQSKDLSAYHLTRAQAERRGGDGNGAPFKVTFATESESRSLPVALASMLSKYLREIHMLLFNRFWEECQPGLKPTAGYAVDASRFLEEIAPARRRLAIDDALLVRCR
jgi:hypothetical protein